MLLCQAPAFALVVAKREQEHLRGDELVASFLRFLVGQIQQIGQIATDLHLAAVSLDLGQTTDGLIERGLERLHIDAGPRQQRRARAVLLLQQGQQQVLRLDHLMVMTDGKTLRIGQSLLKLGSQFVQAHAATLRRMLFVALMMGAGDDNSMVRLQRPARTHAVGRAATGKLLRHSLGLLSAASTD
jgi:hypothetical protein